MPTTEHEHPAHAPCMRLGFFLPAPHPADRIDKLRSSPDNGRMLTCSKTFASIPFAHRQWKHQGHCAKIHGHNWTLTLTFACDQTDANGFVVDFGSLGYIKKWLDDHLDHACVFAHDDPLMDTLVAAAPEAWKVFVIQDSASCEALAMAMHAALTQLLNQHEQGRVWIHELVLWEDEKNHVTFSPPRK